MISILVITLILDQIPNSYSKTLCRCIGFKVPIANDGGSIFPTMNVEVVGLGYKPRFGYVIIPLDLISYPNKREAKTTSSHES